MGWLLVLGLKESLVKCAPVCVKKITLLQIYLLSSKQLLFRRYYRVFHISKTLGQITDQQLFFSVYERTFQHHIAMPINTFFCTFCFLLFSFLYEANLNVIFCNKLHLWKVVVTLLCFCQKRPTRLFFAPFENKRRRIQM